MEYKIIQGNPIDCQTKLNHWKHDYTIEIVQIDTILVNSGIYMVFTLIRTKKDK